MLNFAYLCFLFLAVASLSAQSPLEVIPGYRISGIPAIVDSTSIEDFLSRTKKSFTKTDNGHWETYYSQDSAIILALPKTDLNRIIRRISFSPKDKVVTSDGFVFGKSTALEMDNYYDNTRASYGKMRLLGMTFIFDGKEDDALLQGIRIEGDDYLYHRPNFAYDYSLMTPVIDALLLIALASEYSKEDIQRCFAFMKDKENGFRIEHHEGIERVLDGSLNQRQIKVATIGRKLFLNLIYRSSDKTIFYARLASSDSIFYEKNNLIELVSAYPNKSIETIVAEIKSLNDPQTFGFGCSVSGSPPPLCVSMYNLVSSRNFGRLKIWSNSINPEYAAYGYVGLKWLTYKSRSKQREYQPIFKSVEARNPQLYSCSGCSYSNRFRLKDHGIFQHWKDYYKAARSNGWLRNWDQ